MNEKQLLEIGFEKVPHFTVMNSLTYDIGKGRFLSIGCIGEANECLFLCFYERENEGKNKPVDDIITLHNYDWTGLLTMDKLKYLIDWLKL